MRRKLFNFLASASLVLCLAAITFAVRGIWRADTVSYGGTSWTAMVGSSGSAAWWTFWFDATAEGRGLHAASHPAGGAYFGDLPTGEIDWLGFSAFTGRTDPSASSLFGGNRPYGTIIVPHWMLAAAAGVLPAFWMMKRCRARRFGLGRCRRCGYDLRATPERCPECGATPHNPPMQRTGAAV